tara:strand:- start:262 stop:645 length:384 start_codon:yes stop_codon:yes gene_type:complete
MKLTEYLNAINHSKDSLMDGDDLAEKKYAPFVVNRCLSYFPDTVLHANNMNFHHMTDKKCQFDYFVGAIRKRKRFSKWLKNETESDLEVVKKHYGYSNTRAREVMDMLSPDNIAEIRSRYGECPEMK